MNSFKTFINKVGERVREVAPATGPTVVEGTDPYNELVEGFLCPTCLESFESSETLESHYASEHLEDYEKFLCPTCMMYMNSQSDLLLHYENIHAKTDTDEKTLLVLKEELKEVQGNLEHEKWHSEELKKEIDQLQQAFMKKEGEDSENYVHKSRLDATEESRSALLLEVGLLRKQFADALDQIALLRSDKVSAEQKLTDITTELVECKEAKSEKDTAYNALEKQLLEKDEKLQGMLFKFNETEQDCANTKETLQHKIEEIDDLSDQILSLHDTIENLRINTNSEPCEDKEPVTERTEIDQLKASLDSFKLNEKKLRILNDSQQTELTKYKSSIKKHQEELDTLKKQYNESLESQKQMQITIDKLKDDNQKKKINLQEFDKSMIDSLNKCKDLSEKVEQKDMECTDLKEKMEQFKAETSGEISKLTQIKTENLQRIDYLEKSLDKITKEEANLIAELEQNKKILEENLTILHETKESLNSANDRLESNIKESLEKSQLLETLQSDIASKETELEAMRKQLTENASTLKNIEQNNSEREEVLAEMQAKLVAAESESAGLAGDKVELEVKLEASTEEQQSLLNRCVSSETELQRLQVELSVHRRKLEDTVAALHELARENQTLQMENAKLAGRKWVEDSEVPNCISCSKSFSMTVRKHHCRNCGQIFCNDCSSKQILVKPNKKPVRVCDNCHSEILSKS